MIPTDHSYLHTDQPHSPSQPSNGHHNTIIIITAIIPIVITASRAVSCSYISATATHSC